MVVLVGLIGWCTHSRQGGQIKSQQVRVELAQAFLEAGLADGSGMVDVDRAAKRAGEAGMNRLLYESAGELSLDALRWMVRHGADPQHVGAGDQGTLLQRVAQKPRIDRLSFFIDELKLDPRAPTPDGVGLIHIAAHAGADAPTLRYLRDKGLDPLGLDRGGRQPIHQAAIKSIAPLLAAGADINAIDGAGRTALHWAAAEGRHDAVVELLSHGASAFVADKKGNTALHLAAMKRSEDVIDSLLDAGASRAARNADDLTPRDLYERQQYRNDYQRNERVRKL